MEQQAFDFVIEKVGEALAEQGFARAGDAAVTENGRAALFAGENAAYSILFNAQQLRFELRTCGMTEEGPDEKWKSISLWLFDPTTDTIKEAESIVNDFSDTIRGPKRVAALQTAKKRRKDEDNNSDPLFFFNRLVGVIPELKEDLAQERIQYGDVRAVTFAREKALPRIEAMLTQSSKDEQAKKLAGILNDMYVAGDMDVRSIITIVLLNGIENQTALANLRPELSEDLQKAHKFALKKKGKNIKPEKVKKKSKFMADALQNNQNR